ncbi:MAG TPA: sulfurtransferase [Bacteroidales bacterium]|jgi:hypothetical protein|nr:sulfurtransferase [Bacteroidales bacterium]
MGPLIPNEIIGANWDFLIALLVGIGFGYILERAGFSSSRKLAGVFYGYDFVVLRVFFTAAITAAIGLYYFQYFEWIDLSMIYINPLYLTSTLIGGVIMGFGFIIGGYCPGTSVCGAMIGKIDAMVFIGGIFLGIFFYGETYELLWKKIYLDNFLGAPLVFDSLGISNALFILGLSIAALLAFWITAQIPKFVKRVDY